MEIRITKNDNLNVISLNGKLDVFGSQQAKEAILDKMTTQENIIIDMSHCNFVSNYGLYLLSVIADKAKLLNINAIFVSITDKISEIFYLTGFTDTITLEPTVEDAIKNILWYLKNMTRCKHALRRTAY